MDNHQSRKYFLKGLSEVEEGVGLEVCQHAVINVNLLTDNGFVLVLFHD